MSLERKYKYKTHFQAFAKAGPQVDESKRFAVASIADLGKVFSDAGIAKKIEQNPDLLFISSNLILCDYANLNDDCVRKEDVLAMKDKFVSKYIDVEHDRSRVVGAICDVGFSLYPSNKIVDFAQASETDSPLQLVIGGYIWRVVMPELADYIEMASLESSPSYGDASTSFELMFDDYDIAIGPNGNRDVKAARIVTDVEEFKKMNKVLRCNGGSGKVENDIVYRVLKSDILPNGAGVVAKPASGLKGILAVNSGMETLSEVLDVEAQKSSTEDEKLISNLENNTKNNINITESSVNTPITIKSMKIEKLEDLDKKWSEIKSLETAASVTEFVVANVRQEIEQAIALKSEEFAAKIKAEKELVATVELAKTEIEKKNKELDEVVATLKKELDAIKASQLAAASEEKFNARMAAFDEEFDLDDEDRQIIAQDLKMLASDDMDEDEEEGDGKFKAYMGKQKKLMKEKSKSVKKAKADEAAALALASKTGAKETVDIKSVVASVTEISNQEISNGVHTTESLADKYRGAFAESVSIGGVPLKNFKK
jgi:hypothetical protein